MRFRFKVFWVLECPLRNHGDVHGHNDRGCYNTCDIRTHSVQYKKSLGVCLVGALMSNLSRRGNTRNAGNPQQGVNFSTANPIGNIAANKPPIPERKRAIKPSRINLNILGSVKTSALSRQPRVKPRNNGGTIENNVFGNPPKTCHLCFSYNNTQKKTAKKR